MNKPKYILDTDIGDDIDDAYALALIAADPEAKLLGVATAHLETRKRAELAAKLLKVMGRNDVPVFAGRRTGEKVGRQCEWAQGFRSRSLKSEEAVAFMRREIERSPGEVTLIAVGPLTNLGDLLARYPEVKGRIKRIVVMGGALGVGYREGDPAVAEYNFAMDVAAARAVLQSGVPLVMAGLEATIMLKFDAERQKRLFAAGTPLTDALAALTNLWGEGAPILYDPMAVAYALGHEFCDTESRCVEIEENGLTRIGSGAPNARVLINTRKDEFLDWYISRIARSPVAK